MAEHTHKTYSCDRCKADLGEERPNRAQKTYVSAAFNWTEGPGPVFEWRDLCDPCDEAVKAFFTITMYPTPAQKASARAWFTQMLRWANTDMADHNMVRALRMLTPKDEGKK